MLGSNDDIYVQISRITGSTARAYLEYIERNLPEGVSIEITKVNLINPLLQLHILLKWI